MNTENIKARLADKISSLPSMQTGALAERGGAETA